MSSHPAVRHLLRLVGNVDSSQSHWKHEVPTMQQIRANEWKRLQETRHKFCEASKAAARDWISELGGVIQTNHRWCWSLIGNHSSGTSTSELQLKNLGPSQICPVLLNTCCCFHFTPPPTAAIFLPAMFELLRVLTNSVYSFLPRIPVKPAPPSATTF